VASEAQVIAAPAPASTAPPSDHPLAAEDHGHGHSLLQHQFDDLPQQRECNSLGMWLFLATELMMFGGLFFAYSFYRWKFDGAFHVGSRHLDITLGTINTFVLLFSSLTMALAVWSATTRKKGGLVFWLGLTWLFGAAFLGIKAVEWTTDWNHGLIPGLNWTYYDHHPEELAKLAAQNITTAQVQMYFTVYFCMTGLHAIHMIVGLGVVTAFMILGARGAFTSGNDQPVEIMGLYWHLVDIIWVFLFPLLYLIAGFHPGGGGH
jgi:cytochrome c oxidase subunit 3